MAKQYDKLDREDIAHRIKISLAQGLKPRAIHKALVAAGFKAPKGKGPIYLTYVRNVIAQIHKKNRASPSLPEGIELVETDEFEEVEELTEVVELEEVEELTPCHQIVFDILANNTIADPRKIGMLQAYYGQDQQ